MKGQLLISFLLISIWGFCQTRNVLEPAIPSTSQCFRALHKTDPATPYKIIFDNDTINQFQNNKYKAKYGRWVYFRKNGYVEKEGYYDWDMKQGYWRYYNKKTQLYKIVKYKNDQVLEIHSINDNSKKIFEYKKLEYKKKELLWDFGESRFLEKGNCE